MTIKGVLTVRVGHPSLNAELYHNYPDAKIIQSH